MGLVVSAIWWTVLLAFAVYFLLKWIPGFIVFLKRRRAVMRLPGVPPPNFLTGHITDVPGTNEEALKFVVSKQLCDYPRLGQMFYGPIPAVWVAHPDTVKTILKTSEPKPIQMLGYKFFKPWLGEGLLLAGGKRWARNRRLLTPAFHFDILKPYTKVNNDAVDILLNKMEKFADSGEYMEIYRNVSLCTFDIILRCAFSYKDNVQEEGDSHPYVAAVNTLTESAVYRVMRPWFYPDFLFYLTPVGRKFRQSCDLVHGIADNVIKKRRETLFSADSPKTSDKSDRYLDFLDILLTATDDAGRGLTDLEIRNEVDTFMFEGHDTTASSISWTLFSLAQNPEHQRQCQQEVDAILQGRDSTDILWDDLSSLHHLTLCIKEAMRLHTPVPIVSRLTTKDSYLDGHYLPAGTVVDIQLYLLLHNPAVWEKPMEFIPERFASDTTMDSFQFVPFSAGPRNCIGQNFAMHEMKVVVARILQRFDLELKPGHYVGHEMQAVMKTENGMYMKLTRRQ